MTHAPQPATSDAGDVGLEIHEGIATLSFAHAKGNSLPSALLRTLDRLDPSYKT